MIATCRDEPHAESFRHTHHVEAYHAVIEIHSFIDVADMQVDVSHARLWRDRCVEAVILLQVCEQRVDIQRFTSIAQGAIGAARFRGYGSGPALLGLRRVRHSDTAVEQLARSQAGASEGARGGSDDGLTPPATTQAARGSQAAAKQRLNVVKPRDRVTIGQFQIEFLRVTHSMPDCVALAITTPRGVVIHTGDFKVDQTPLDGEDVGFHRLGQLGAARVLGLHGDSPNVERRGFAHSVVAVVAAIEEIFTSARGKIVVAAFASSIYRMQILVDLAAQFDRGG